jgi:putative ABC transport system permease protein
VISDLRHAIRSFGKTPALTGIILVTLALGIGANTAIFSVVYAVLLRPAPLADMDRLAMLWETDRNTGTTREPSSFPDFQDFQHRSRTFGSLGAMLADEMNLTPVSGEPRRVATLQITSNLLPLLGLRPLLGRTFTDAETTPHGPSSIIISESLWEQEFGRDPAAIGRTIRLDDQSWTVIGVMPRDADFGVLQILSAAAYSRSFADRGEKTPVGIWAPLQADEQSLPRQTHPIIVVGRLANGATAHDAQTELTTITADLEHAFQSNAGRGAHVEPLGQVVTGPVRPALLLLVAAVGLVLVVACVNVASLLLARGAARVREVAIRGALGADSSRLMRLFLAESALLTIAAAALGLGAAYAGVRLMLAFAPADVPRLTETAVNLPVLGVTLAISLIVSFAFAMIPALQAGRVDVQPALRGLARSSEGPEHRRLQQTLAVAELAFAVLLVCGAGLLIKSFWRVQSVDPGFRAAGVLKAEYQLPPSRYPVNFRNWPDFREQHAFTRELLARARALPGVLSAAVAGNHPLDPGFTNSFTIVGREAESRDWPEISIRRVSTGYFETVGLTLRRGRLFQDSDSTKTAPVALLNEAAVRRFFGDRDPIGARIRFWGDSRTIVGVVADEKFHGLTEASPIAAYTPLSQTPSANGAGVLLVRTAQEPTTMATEVRGAIRSVDAGLAIFGVEPLTVTMGRSVSQRTFTMNLMIAFAALALLLASLGVYGVLNYGVAQRRQEIGIRLALGAAPRALVAAFMREGLAMTAAGVALGLGGALVLTRLFRTLLFEVTPTDPVTFLAVTCVLAIVAGIAALAPALRAARVDPLVVLRSE